MTCYFIIVSPIPLRSAQNNRHNSGFTAAVLPNVVKSHYTPTRDLLSARSFGLDTLSGVRNLHQALLRY